MFYLQKHPYLILKCKSSQLKNIVGTIIIWMDKYFKLTITK